MTVALALLLLQAAAADSPSAEAERLFALGSTLVAEGDTAGAVAAWEGAVATGWTSAAAEHNLGTVALARGDAGRARLHLERAAHLDPESVATAHNLRIAREAAGVGARPAWHVAWDRAVGVARPVGLVALALGLAFAALGVLFLDRRRTAAALGLVALAAVGAASAALWERTRAVAVVVAPEADVREAPSASAPGVARVRAGETVGLGEARAGWRAVTADGEAGWVPEGTVERL